MKICFKIFLTFLVGSVKAEYWLRGITN